MRGGGKMRRLGGSGGRKRGGGAFGRSASVLAILLGLLAPAVPVLANNGQWDYWGRTRPLPYYWVKWSADDGVCKRITKALNGAGPSPASLYGDPIFLRWQSYPNWPQHFRHFIFEVKANWMEAPFFNDGNPVIALKLVSPSSRFINEYLFVFDDIEYFRAFKPVPLVELLKDSLVLQPYKPFTENNLGSFAALPKTMRDEDYWSRIWFENDVEINLATVVGKIYLVVREPALEAILVLLFSDNRKGQAVCVMGLKKLVR
ncbi:MAG: hypothetical protein ACHQRJ_10705 [Alphaproteobacteria bacterium]